MAYAYLYLAVSSAFVAAAFNAWRPRYAPAPLAAVSFFAGWLTSELALHHIVAQAIAAAAFYRAGALAFLPGQVALALSIATWPFLYRAFVHGHSAREAVAAAVTEALAVPPSADDAAPISQVVEAPARFPWKDVLLPFPVRHPGVECVRKIPFHRYDETRQTMRVDVHRSRASREKSAPATGRAPTLVYLHGGGWVIGQKRYQGLPIMQHLAARGWVCFSVDYRLSPRATFPDHLIDVKRAIAWVKAHAEEYGADPDFVVIAGNSAGAHLAALAALTPNDPEYQPGFEAADTHVDGCIALYGIYDFHDRNGAAANAGLGQLLARFVMKASRVAAKDAYTKASPIDRIHAGAPPFFLVHGDGDTLAPVQQARDFYAAFRARARAPIGYAEIPGAQHAFEIFPSIRTAHLLQGVGRFASHLRAQYEARRAARADRAA